MDSFWSASLKVHINLFGTLLAVSSQLQVHYHQPLEWTDPETRELSYLLQDEVQFTI